jgi:hypothetical protein
MSWYRYNHVLPVLLDEEYWSFQYRVFYNTSITSIVGPVIENVDWSLHWIEFGDASSDVVNTIT